MTLDDGILVDLQRAVDLSGQFPGDRFSGRGIVICAGGPSMLTNAYVLVRILRDQLGSTLPIELWHLGTREMPGFLANVFESFGCRIVDALVFCETYPGKIYDGWQLKAYSLIHSSFEEVVMLDADQVPLIDPAHIFGWSEFKETGAIFWPDIVDLSSANLVWDLLGLEPRRVRSWETGQICINKRIHWATLAIVLRMNELSDTFYELVYGDKDTFLLAWTLDQAKKSLVPHPPMFEKKFLGQRDFSGDIVFQHRTNCKWSLFEDPYRPDGFVFQEECEAFLEDLRKFWNGRHFDPPARSAAARDIENQLVSQRDFSLFLSDEQGKPVELLPGHQIGIGRSFMLSNWIIRDGKDAPELIFFDYFFPSLVLVQSLDDGSWQGKTLSPLRRDVILRPSLPGDQEAKMRQSLRGLADDFIDIAIRSALPKENWMTQLASALELLAQIEPDVAERLRYRADEIGTRDLETADGLRRIAADVSKEEQDMETQPNKKMASTLFSDPRYYIRP